jgi:hypothetical protein
VAAAEGEAAGLLREVDLAVVDGPLALAVNRPLKLLPAVGQRLDAVARLGLELGRAVVHGHHVEEVVRRVE